MAVNKVILLGNLGADPEVRALDGGSKVANFNIATTERYIDKSGEKKETTEWHRLELWGRLAGVAEQYLKKGDKVFVEGKLKTDSWQDKDGNTKYATKVLVLSLEMLTPKNSGQPTGANSDEDDLPF